MVQADILRLLQQYLAPYAMTPPPRPMQYAQFGKPPPPEDRVLSPDGLSGHTAFDIAPQLPMQSGDPVINLPRIGTYDAPWIDPNNFAAKYRRFNPDVNARVYSDFLTPGEPQYPGVLNSMIGKLK